jgi:hypothetical protein
LNSDWRRDSTAIPSKRIAVDEKINRDADAQSSNREAGDGDDEVDRFRLFGNSFGSEFFFGHKRRESFFQGGGDDFFVLELKSEPAAVEFIFPFHRQARKNLGCRRLKAETFPEWRAFLRPDAKDAVIGSERLDALPK